MEADIPLRSVVHRGLWGTTVMMDAGKDDAETVQNKEYLHWLCRLRAMAKPAKFELGELRAFHRF